MLRNPTDVSTRASVELSELIEAQTNNPDLEEPLTLSMLRDFVTQSLPSEVGETESLHHFDSGISLIDELDSLIGEYGDDALAFDFLQYRSSEQMSRVIDAVINERDETAPTLDEVKSALQGGLAMKLVGEGVLDEDEDDSLVSEIEDLIARYGGDALAENFMRYD